MKLDHGCVKTEQHATMLLEVICVTVVTVGQETAAKLVITHQQMFYDVCFNAQNCFPDINECTVNANVNPCKNNGSCFNSDGSFECQCMPGFTGKTCDSGKALICIT